MTGAMQREGCPYGVLLIEDGTVKRANQAARALLTPEGSAIGQDVAAAFPDSVAATLPSLFAGGGPTERHTFEEYYPDLDRWLETTVAPGDPHVVYIHDVTDTVDARQEVESVRAEFDRVSLVTDLLSEVLQELVNAADRNDVIDTICETLGERDAFEFAWLGELDSRRDGLRVRAAAGETGETFGAIRDHLADTPERAALEAGEARVVDPIAEATAIPAPLRRAAFADGVQSLVAIPLTYGDAVHGVLGVYAASVDAFSDRTRETFETLGAIAGFVVNAARNQNLLFADTITEITLEIHDAAAPLVAATGATDATVDVNGTVPQETDGLVCYLSVTGGTGVADELRTRSSVESVRILADYDSERRMEVVFGEQTPLTAVTRLGASVGGATYEDGRGLVRAELPTGEDVRQVVDAVRRRFDAETIAKVQRERSVTTAAGLREELSDALTDRQATVLQTAYLAGYFESPRDSTAEEVGEVLGITGSTLLHHLRTGQRKLLDAYFEADSGTGVDDPRGDSGPVE